MCSPVKENCFLLYSQPFWHYLESAQITQVKGWVSQDCPPLQTPITSPGLPYFCPTGYTSGVPNTPSSGLISCWNSWKNSGKHFTMSSLLQRIHSGGAKWKRHTGQGLWGGAWSFHAPLLWVHHPLSTLMCSPAQKLCALLRFGFIIIIFFSGE